MTGECGVHCGKKDGIEGHCPDCHEINWRESIKNDGTTETWNDSTHGARPLLYQKSGK